MLVIDHKVTLLKLTQISRCTNINCKLANFSLTVTIIMTMKKTTVPAISLTK